MKEKYWNEKILINLIKKKKFFFSQKRLLSLHEEISVYFSVYSHVHAFILNKIFQFISLLFLLLLMFISFFTFINAFSGNWRKKWQKVMNLEHKNDREFF
jgi:hypothetical protein